MEASSETSSSSSPPPPPRLSLRSPALQAEFLQKRRNKFGSQSDEEISSSSSLSNGQTPDIMEPSSETSSSSSPAPPLPRLSLRSPALQAEFLQ
ncbi:hypothetical protein NQZ68_032808, partial [Dissostichus eleginoides]